MAHGVHVGQLDLVKLSPFHDYVLLPLAALTEEEPKYDFLKEVTWQWTDNPEVVAWLH